MHIVDEANVDMPGAKLEALFSPFEYFVAVVVAQGTAKSFGDWYFDRAQVKAIDCPYPCDGTCRNII
jgi:hypothetical protein